MIPERLKSQFRNNSRQHSQSSLSGISKDFAELFANRQSNLASFKSDDDDDDGHSSPQQTNMKYSKVKHQYKRRASPFAKGFSHGFGAKNTAQSN